MKDQEIQSQMSQERIKQQIAEGIEQADRGELVDHDPVIRQLKARAAEMADNEQ